MASFRGHRRRKRQNSHFRHEIDDLVRGVCGGFLFGVPLLYTMEIWWLGSSASPSRLLAVLLITLVVVYLLSRTAGFRKLKATKEEEAIADAIEAVAIGLVCAALTLIILRQITLETRLSDSMGKIIFESVPFSLGVALSNQFLGDSDSSSSDQPDQAAPPSLSERFFPEGNLNETIADLGATLIGAVIIAFSIAPTDEVTVLVASVENSWLILTVMGSLALSYGIVFQADFTQQGQRRLQSGLFQDPLGETLFSYLISLIAAALMLGFFGQISFSTPWDLAFREIIILGLPATVGGAAGRLAL
ncbi:MAG: TIGR02587 family membrane protein [Phormidesmis sp.]